MRLPLLLAAALFAAPAWAGPQFVDETGYAVSGYDVVAYWNLPQSEIGTAQAAAVPGSAAYTAEYNGAVFAFASAENRDRFLADPAKYAPQYDGHCAYGVAQGGKVPGNPNLWRIVDGKLYLNITENVVGFWEADIPGNLTLSEGNWPGLEPQPAATIAIPGFESEAPVN
jgi:YHS domain-containing protein